MNAGLNALVAAQAFGATRIVITDVREDNLPLAEQLGAKFPLLTPPSMTDEKAAKLIESCLPPNGPDCVIDCAGYKSTVLVRSRLSATKVLHQRLYCLSGGLKPLERLDTSIGLQTGMEALASGGTYVLVGMGTDCCDSFPTMTLVTKEADVKGCFRYTNTVR